MRVTNVSRLTGRKHTRDLPVTLAELERFEAGELAHVVWPHLSADDREFLVTGITPDEERNLLPPEDEEAWGC